MPARIAAGRATASTPLLGDPLSGPVHLALTDSPPPDEEGVELPRTVVFLRGPGVTLRLVGDLRLTPEGGRLESVFDGLPDVPLTRFTLTFDGGGKGRPGPFQAADDLCSGTFQPADATLTDADGRERTTHPVLDAAACRKGPRVLAGIDGLGTARPTVALDVRPPLGGRPLRRVAVSLPRDLRARPERAGRGIVVRADGRRVSRGHWSLSRGGRLVIGVPDRRGARRVTVSIGRGALVPDDRIRARVRQIQSTLNSPTTIPLALRVYGTDVRQRKTAMSRTIAGRP